MAKAGSQGLDTGLDAEEIEPSHCAQKHDFEMISVLGKGAYGKVVLVRKKRGHDKGQMFALKTLKKQQLIQQ